MKARKHGKLRGARFVVCLKNRGYPASLEKRKLYRVIPDRLAQKHGCIRVVDESGEDYLYPKDYFGAVAMPLVVRRAVIRAA